ncbi:MAG: hypothetical protein ACI87A_001203 [Planctomycetota bacterium]|jgi:hypothetical protein
MQPVLQELDRMTEDRFLAIYDALSDRGFGPLDGNVASALKFRPHAIRKLPFAQRAKKAKSLILGSSDAETAYDLLGSFLVKHHKELITDFLDATGVPHDEGMIEDLRAAAPDADKLPDAIKGLDEKFEPDHVTIYLAMCSQQWPDSEHVVKLWNSRAE